MTILRTPDLEAAVDAILVRAGTRVVCGTPLSNSGADVDFPAPFGPAMMKRLGMHSA